MTAFESPNFKESSYKHAKLALSLANLFLGILKKISLEVFELAFCIDSCVELAA